VWMAPDVFICSHDFQENSNSYDWWDWFFLGIGGDDTRIRLTAGAATTATCDFLLRLFATCEQNGVSIRTRDTSVPLPGTNSEVTAA
jgi:hypothetical protein